MINTQQAQLQLNLIKEKVIGIFKLKHIYFLVMDWQETNQTIDLLRITEFGALQQEFNMPISFGTLHLFPDDKNMNEMLNSPFDWDDFMKQF